MKKDLLVTLSDQKYLHYARQMFDSALRNSDWDGEMMLLSRNVSKENLDWFISNNIIVKEVSPVTSGVYGGRSAVAADKFYLFDVSFKKWKTVVFLDADVVVRGSLDILKNPRSMLSVMSVKNFIGFFDGDHVACENICKKICPVVNLKDSTFGSGVMSYNTDIIKEDSLSELKKIFFSCCYDFKVPEELSLNLYFYGKWKRLPVGFLIDRFYIKNNLKVIQPFINLIGYSLDHLNAHQNYDSNYKIIEDKFVFYPKKARISNFRFWIQDKILTLVIRLVNSRFWQVAYLVVGKLFNLGCKK